MKNIYFIFSDTRFIILGALTDTPFPAPLHYYALKRKLHYFDYFDTTKCATNRSNGVYA